MTGTSAFRAACAAALVSIATAQEIQWRDAGTLTVEGRAFADRAAAWDRLPRDAEGVVPAAVWSLSRQSAGIVIRFRSNASRIDAHWRLTSDDLAMPHMPASGKSGLDLYVRDGDRIRWVGAARPDGIDTRKTIVDFGEAPATAREYLCYLPLYNGVVALEIGVPTGAVLEPAPARPVDAKPLVFYGTSITQGGCASRPGTCHTALLGRRLDREVVNLGFSGNGKLDLPLADLLARIDAAVYVVDCLPNLTPELVAARTEPFVRRLRELRPTTPILLVEDRTNANAPFVGKLAAAHRAKRAALADAVAALRAAGIDGLTVLPGDRLLGTDGDDTVDGSHPTDLGFVRHADAFEPVLREILGG